MHHSIRSLVVTLLLIVVSAPTQVLATAFRAVSTGNWSNPAIWSPNGVPGSGDRVLGLGSNRVTVTGTQEIGTGGATDAITLDGEGRLTLDSGATLTVNGNFHAAAFRAEIVIRDNARLLFSPSAGQIFHFQQSSSEQRVTFDGRPGARGKIGLAPNAAGHYFFVSGRITDSLLNGSYGIIEDAFDPVSEIGWDIPMGNEPGISVVEADHIEFLRCGRIYFIAWKAGEFTQVRLDALTFREQAKSGSDFQRAQFWFDGFSGITEAHPAPATTNFITNVVSDTEINIRFVQDYVLDNYVLDSGGHGHARLTNNGGNAVSHSNVFIALGDSGPTTSLIADTTENTYIYSESDNPHGWSTHQLRGDAVLRNFWFESRRSQQTDHGEAVLTNGPQRFVNVFGGATPTLTLEHSGTIGDSLDPSKHPLFFSFNESTGIRLIARHNVARVADDINSVAMDENGITRPGAGVALTDNVFFADDAVNGSSAYVIGSASGPRVINSDTFDLVDYNLYWQLASDGDDGSLGVHRAPFSRPIDSSSVTIPPLFFDDTRNIASWDRSLGGPGTARHAIDEMKKRNDDSGFDARYDVAALTEFVATGFAVTNAQAVASDGLRMGPALHLPSVAPAILKQPQDQNISAEESVTLTVENTGVPLPNYQWQLNGNDISGATSNNYIFVASSSNAGGYSVRIFNASGSTTSDTAVVRVDGSPAGTVTTPNNGEPRATLPIIVTQPASTAVSAGATATFSVVASGDPTPGYQWRRNGAGIPNETSSTLSIPNTTTADAASYDVEVTNSAGRVTSNSATLSVEVVPAVPTPVTPAPVTPAPVTPAPVTPAPETPAPEVPTIIRSVALNDTTILISFSESISNSAELLANTSIDQNVQVLSGFQNAPDQLTLTTTVVTVGINYSLRIEGTGDSAQATNRTVTAPITFVDTNVNILSAVLPTSRSVEVGNTATAFATLINTGTTNAEGCSLDISDNLGAVFTYNATNSATNVAVGQPNPLIDLPVDTPRSFVFGITSTQEIPATNVPLKIQCENAIETTDIEGLNTLLLSASSTSVPDLIALVATVSNNGVMELARNRGFFTAASINVGSTAVITVSADTGEATLPVTLRLCQTNPLTSECINPRVPTEEPLVLGIESGAIPTFAVFAQATDAIALDPANSRVFLRFTDQQGLVRGTTSVAVQSLTSSTAQGVISPSTPLESSANASGSEGSFAQQ